VKNRNRNKQIHSRCPIYIYLGKENMYFLYLTLKIQLTN
jgi:hypothetical protein